MAIVSGNPAAAPSGSAASGLNPGLTLIAAAPVPEACLLRPQGRDPYEVGVLRVIDREVGMNKAAIGGGDIALLAGLDRARACLKLSAPSKGHELPSWLSAKSNSRNGDVNSAKKELILAAQDVATRQGSLRFLQEQADQIPSFMKDLEALLSNTAPAQGLSNFQSQYRRATDGFTKAQERYKAARERVTSLTRELTNELKSQRR
jgi:hypothetical protein